MNTRRPAARHSLYAYAWDLAGRDTRSTVDEILDLGVDGLSLAASYHAGKFMRPRATGAGKVYFPEDGTVYFNPQPARYRAIQPQPHSDAAVRQVAYDLADDGRLKLSAWTILFHNTRLGEARPELTVKNAWGDSYVYAPCPMQPQLIDYATDLSTDLASALPWQSLTLESPGWAPYAHGYHHEFAQVRSNVWLDTMLGLCFCDACKTRAREDGIDAVGLAARIRTRVDGYLNGPADASDTQAAAWLAADILDDIELAAFLRMRQRHVTSIVSRIRAAIPAEVALYVIPTVQRPTAQTWLEGTDLKAMAHAADGIEVPFYEPDANRVLADALDTIRRVGDAKRVRGILRPGVPDLGDGAQTGAALAGLQRMGIEHVGFYNYGMLRQVHLDGLRGVLKK
ncbi:hypothetical protein [Silvimonas iriomotensis]|uniref:Uncharacterized protein n=1 Tax=Silvimonas iriomotensis TaxID=449662 RepID=A0ABQ2PF76_9NEIS|nr:hypothetical protein [Silvimonas iriomotensis]GGP24026.1 hypothetical protein GCM10010970_40260 [Silvimonas iriomotensis]